MFGYKAFCRLLMLLLLPALLTVSAPLLAATPQPDVRLVVDISGSMRRTDPNNLRIPATNLLIDLLPADSRAGIWTFGAYVNMLVPHGAVDEAWRTNARQQAAKINSVALFTDIENAIERASWDHARPAPGRERHIILLSDGLVDISEKPTAAARAEENQKSRDHLLRTLVPRLADAGFVIHTLALSDEADHDLMATMAQRTGGLHAIAYDADDLMPLLLQILNRFMPSEEVPLLGNRFLIDSAIDEFTALVFHAPAATVALHAPSGQRHSREEPVRHIRWHGNERYTLITVSRPEAGEWRIETPEHPDNRVTVVSDIRLQSSGFPSTVYRGFPQQLEVWFTEEGQVVGRREFLGLLESKAHHSKGGQVLGEYAMPLAANRPRYATSITEFPQLGEQTLKVEVDGRTFRRQLVHSFNVQDVVAATLQQPEDGSPPRVILRTQHPELRPSDIRFTITANGQPLTPEYRGDGEWKVDLGGLDRSQAQTLEVEVQGQLQNRAIQVDLPNMLLPPRIAGTQASRPDLMDSPADEPPPPAFVPTLPPAQQAVPAPIVPVPPAAQPAAPVPAPAPAPAPGVPAEPAVAPEAEAVAPPASSRGIELPSLDLSPIESWDDPRMLWIYIALGVANILLFLIAFLMYRRFVNKRKAREQAQNMEAVDLELEDLDDGLDFDDQDDRR
ncbi:VWA domain-containing protein [Marinospirillum alkaliphilum]|uniref:TIGR03503 family protein n=1 Tax=Marinospirillum alkaliphilum DSM 21637 TaxID=1122209 RepID=A0A1K1TZ81_9GAMM|nr:vWA domain-containing protein [Marinospirillum alkaliphilum]SFX05435.1 TIGR03503 family protein [Marinospirillum alkaliphilum DSM 21637]